MYNPQASFRNILSPTKSEDFFTQTHGRKALYIPGPEDKFEGLFDWEDLNRYLDIEKAWDSTNVKMVLDSEPVPPNLYCTNGKLDRALLINFLEQGATLALIGFETLSKGAAAIYKSIQAAMGAPCYGNLYFSQKGHAGFRPHFDLMDVFVIQISGEKLWHIYETQFENPMFKPGYHQMSFNHEYHQHNKGEVETELTLTPGDVLYVPRGKYHAALATSDTSLHLTFGVEPARGYDYLQALIETMPDDPLFRAELPHFDDVEAHETILKQLASQMQEKMANPKFMADMRDEQRRWAYQQLPVFSLPNGLNQSGYRVRVSGSKLVRRGKSWQLQTPMGQSEIPPDQKDLVEWMLLSDLFTFENLSAAFPDKAKDNLNEALSSLSSVGLIEPLK
jgi:bifunctional lysine-specific demethylase and histidyl-hydroxylase MINA